MTVNAETVTAASSVEAVHEHLAVLGMIEWAPERGVSHQVLGVDSGVGPGWGSGHVVEKWRRLNWRGL